MRPDATARLVPLTDAGFGPDVFAATGYALDTFYLPNEMNATTPQSSGQPGAPVYSKVSGVGTVEEVRQRVFEALDAVRV